MKINANDSLGGALFQEYGCSGVPHLVFIDKEQKEIDRIIGYQPPEEYLLNIKDIASNKNTFKELSNKFEQGDYSVETLELLAKKYENKGDIDAAANLYTKLLQLGNLSTESFWKAKYIIAVQALSNGETNKLVEYAETYPESPFTKDAYLTLIRHFNVENNIDEEIKLYIFVITQYPSDPSILNMYAWRMSEIDKNLGHALEMASLAVTLTKSEPQTQANILDTKAEVLFKLKRYNEAINIISEALTIDPESMYFKSQKEKFMDAKNNIDD